ncbi:hypothetical protein HBA55_36960, partial [Pseudomaricurvus alkylphenolicus]|uniref:hypothetical protein n=1 Tax=Pseudomaricurvus alkylphenolicus TaxID=1306991 RepID=UPI001422AF6E
MTLSDGAQVDTDLLTLGANDAAAFVGVNGGSENATGFELSGVDLAVALITDQNDGARQWASVQAEADSAAFVGVEDLTIGGDTMSVSLNLASTDGLVVDYAAQSLEVSTGPDSSITLTMDGSDGELLRASGHAEFDVFGLVSAEGSFGVERASQTVALTDGSSVETDILSIGLSNGAAFAGYDQGTESEDDDIGLRLQEVDLALALFNDQTGGRNWTAVQAAVGSADVVGIDGVTMAVDTVAIEVNKEAADGSLIDFQDATDLEVVVGPDTTVQFDLADDKGDYLQITGNAEFDLFGLVKASGGFGVEKASQTVTLTDGSSVETELLTIGLSNGAAFAGYDQGTESEDDDIGLRLQEVDLALALFNDQVGGRNWTAVQGSVASAEVVGIDGVTMAVDTVAIEVNKEAVDGSLIDFQDATDLEVVVGPDTTVQFDLADDKGDYLQITGNAEFDLFGLVKASGGFGVEKASQTVTLTDGSSVETDMLTIGLSNGAAFAGYDQGTESEDDDIGLRLQEVDLALALFNDQTGGRNWTAVQGSVASAEVVGIDGVTMAVDTVAIEVNKEAVDGSLIDFQDATDLEVVVGPDSTVQFDLADDKGDYLQITGNAEFDLFGLVKASGGFGVEKASQTVVLTDGSSVETDILTIGLSNGAAFAGYDQGTDAEDDDIGLRLQEVDLALALFNDQTGGRNWTAVQGSVASAEVVGIDGVTMAVDTVAIEVNKEAADGSLIDFQDATDLEVVVGPDTTVQFDLADDKGDYLQITGNAEFDLFGLVKASGGFGVEKASQTVTLTDGSSVETELLTIGLSNGAAFAGYDQGTESEDDDIGLRLQEVDLALALFNDQTGGRNWTAVQGSVASAEVVGIDGVTMAVDTVAIEVNKEAADGSLIDFQDATDLEVVVGPDTTVQFDLADDKGDYLQITGNAEFDLFGLVKASGGFGVEKASQTVTLTDGSSVETELLTIGLSNGAAFAGYDQGTDAEDDDIGLRLQEVDLALALFNDQTGGRNWTAVQAAVGSAEVVGIDGVTMAVDTVAIEVNKEAADGSLIDFQDATDLNVVVGPDTTVQFDLADDKGDYLQITGNAEFDLFGLVKASGGFGVEKASQTVTLTDGSSVETELLTIGLSNGAAFAGYDQGTDAEDDDIGLRLQEVDLALALFNDQVGGRNWTAVQGAVGSAAVVGIEGVTMAVDTVAIEVNKEAADGSLIDFQDATDLDVVVGPDTTVQFDLADDKGDYLQITGNAEFDLFGLVKASGGFGVEKASQTVVLTDGSSVETDILTIGLSNGAAFAGYDQGTDAEDDDIGLRLQEVDLALALFNDQVGGRNWTAVQGSVASAEVVGIDGVTMAVDTVAIEVNKEATDGSLIDFQDATDLEVVVGPDTTVQFDLADDKGDYLQITGNAEFDLFGLVKASGGFGVEKASQTVTLTDGSSIETDILTIGLSNGAAFAGYDQGTDAEDDDIGLRLQEVDLALALFNDQVGGRNWTAVQATVGSAGVVGIEGVTMAVDTVAIEINKEAVDGSLIDFQDATDLEVVVGPDTTVQFDLADDKGDYLQITGNAEFDLFGLVKASGDFGVEKSSQSVILTDGSTVQADLLTIGLSNGAAFAGYDQGTESEDDDIGLQLQEVDLALALFGEQGGTRNWTAVQAGVGSAGIVGIDGVTMAVNSVAIEVNQAALDGSLIDFQDATDLDVVVGPDASVHFDLADDKGEYLQVTGSAEFDLFGLVKASGDFGVEKSSQSVILTDGSTVQADLLTIGLSNGAAFAGYDQGTESEDDDIGLQLQEVDLALALFGEQGGTR